MLLLRRTCCRPTWTRSSRKLLGLLQNGQKLVQEGALTAMASVADCAKDNFVKYYDQVRRLRGACPVRS